ncbi:MAG: hypothetical protein ACREF8_03595, partial [Chthoniobacterales bacterium]
VAAAMQLPSNKLALNLGALSALAALLVHSFFDFNLHIPANVLLLAFVFGILANPGLERLSERDLSRSRFTFGRMALPLLALLLAVGCVRYLPAEYCAERARVALRDERHVVAMLWAQRAIAHDPKNPKTWFYLGESRVRRAEGLGSAAARASFERAALLPIQQALALAPDDETFVIALGRIYDSLGRFREAEWMFGRALAWDPRSDVARKSYVAHLTFWKNGKVGPIPPKTLELPDENAPLKALPSVSATPYH